MVMKIVLFILGVSYNQPKFSSCATWNSNAVTFPSSNLPNSIPNTVFVNMNNTIYVTSTGYNCVQVWLEGNSTPTRNYCAGSLYPYAVFVTITGDVYIDNGYFYHQVDKWTSNATNSTVAMYVPGSCYGLFVDIYNNIYCSLFAFNHVMKRSFTDDANTSTIIAGNSTVGSTPNLLNGPCGIWVDIKLNLYVADCNNHRIQFFQSGKLNATTIAGSEAYGTITLLYPTAVVLDADGNLFIADTYNYRIVGSFSSGFRCIAGCSGNFGSGSNRLYQPRSLSFDSYGNLFIADTQNNRIQIFFLSTNSCGKCRIIIHKKDILYEK
jgi:sugar lactone lactonase YvrE